MDAATRGASIAANLVLNITAIVIAFISFIAFLNALISFFGGLVGLGKMILHNPGNKMTRRYYSKTPIKVIKVVLGTFSQDS